MIQTFFIHPHESINFHCQDLSFLLKFIIMEEAKGFLVHKKRWVELWKDKSSKWLLDSENQRCQKQGFLQINVALEVNDHSRLVCRVQQITTTIMFCDLFFGSPPFNKWQTLPRVAAFPDSFSTKKNFSSWPLRMTDMTAGVVQLPWRSCGARDAEEMLVPLTPLKKKVYI